MLSAHDTVAQKNFDPVLPPLPEDLDDDLDEESVKIVRLVKNKEPLVRVDSDLKTKQDLLGPSTATFLMPSSKALKLDLL